MKTNETFQTQVTKECDVFVAGGGIAGIAAALAAAMTDDFGALDVTQLQEKLKNAGVILHEKDL